MNGKKTDRLLIERMRLKTMGYYTWTDAIRKPRYIKEDYDYASSDKIKYNSFAKVVCPDDTEIIENNYDGYGIFGGYDIYELVADWNKPYITEDMVEDIIEPVSDIDQFGGLYDFEKESLAKKGKTQEEIAAIEYAKKKKYWEQAKARHDYHVKRLKDFINNRSDDYMVKKYGNEWKREIGIDIACDDNNNASLHFPIKITAHKEPVKYEDLYPSFNTQ